MPVVHEGLTARTVPDHPDTLYGPVFDGRVWRIPMEIVLRSGRACEVAIWVREEKVAVEYEPGREVLLDRRAFASWLSHSPGGVLILDSASPGFAVVHACGGDKLGIGIPGAEVQSLSPSVLAVLQDRV